MDGRGEEAVGDERAHVAWRVDLVAQMRCPLVN